MRVIRGILLTFILYVFKKFSEILKQEFLCHFHTELLNLYRIYIYIYVYIGNANGTLKVVVPNLNQIDTSSLYSSNEKISERNLCGIKS